MRSPLDASNLVLAGILTPGGPIVSVPFSE